MQTRGSHSLKRRMVMTAAAAALVPHSFAATRANAARTVTITQIVDASAVQQDVSKDFLIGSRAAWQDINAKGGVRGHRISHVSIEVDGTAQGLETAFGAVREDDSCIALSGTAGDPVASQLTSLLQKENYPIAHVAPWLQSSSVQVDDRTFPIFAGRQAQISHALKTLTVMGVTTVGAVYPSAVEQGYYHEDLKRIAQKLKLQLQPFQAAGELAKLGERFTPETPAILLFMGGTPELVQFTQGLESQQRQRYLIALADVNLQTLMQMGGTRKTPVIATQTVPLVTASLPIVRLYRKTLTQLFDEQPSALSLAGFIAARYTYEVLNTIPGPLTRQSVLAAFQRRQETNVDGYRVSFDTRRRAGHFVTQSMLTVDGRVLG